MALWTPYADAALDLSKPNRKSYSPIMESRSNHEYPSPPAVYHFGYNYVPVPQLSPLSATSVGSYDRPYTPQHLSGGSVIDRFTPQILASERSFTSVPTLSPPISPQSQKRNYSMDDSLSDDPDFQAFERDALRAMAEKNGGILLGNNPRMRRNVRSSNNNGDDTYRKQRERNNFAAKQSRDRRKLREIHLALKVSYLRKEIASLKSVLASRVCNSCHQSCRC